MHDKLALNTARMVSVEGILTFKIHCDPFDLLLYLFLLLLDLGDGLTGEAKLHLQVYTRQIITNDPKYKQSRT